jgi:colanic acid/amylovoran biosynthesis glycosyltransferase
MLWGQVPGEFHLAGVVNRVTIPRLIRYEDSRSLPLLKTAYILLWFPKPSETFIFREVVTLQSMGLDLSVYTLYGPAAGSLSPEMRDWPGPVERLGSRHMRRIPESIGYWRQRRPDLVRRLYRNFFVRRHSGLEKTGESLWAFFCAFDLARRFERAGVEHIHAPWAGGPATAAWIASQLTGIPFSFTARAWDIYPPDVWIHDKIRDAALVRSETGRGVEVLDKLAPGFRAKLFLTYNGVPLSAPELSPVAMEPPYNLLALGRFVGKKGYDYLLKACAMLAADGFDFRLTLAGDGPKRRALERLCRRLNLDGRVSFPGFVSYEKVPDLFRRADVFVMPSVVHLSGDRDGIPLVLMEALLHRVPVVATSVSGIPELIQNHDTGVLIPQKNEQAIADAVKNLCADREHALQLAETGRRKILDTFEPGRNYRRVYELYDGLPRLIGEG